nr:hypothetical protein B0A51_14033 [Rachicladosporium sp. CCFEE 5018]
MDFVQIRVFLHVDPRPTCIFDTQAVLDDAKAAAPRPSFTNNALQSKASLIRDTFNNDEPRDGARSRLQSWIINADQSMATFSEYLDGRSVFGYVVENRWRVVQWQDKDENRAYSACAMGNGRSEESRPVEHLVYEPLLVEHPKFRNENAKNSLLDQGCATTRLASMHATMEMIDVGFFEYALDGNLNYANEAFYKLSGHPRADSSGFSWLDCVFEEERSGLMEHWVSISEGRSSTFEMRWKRPAATMLDGQEDTQGQWVLAACLPVKDRDGQVVGVSGCITDIAATKHNESEAVRRAEILERAQISERRFTKFADEANVGIYIVDTNMQITYCNRAWHSITGHPVVDFEDVDWAKLVVDGDLAIVAEGWKSMLETNTAKTFQFRFQKPWTGLGPGKGPTWVLCHVYPEPNDEGLATTFAGHLTDISHLKWAETEQKRRTDQAIEARRQQENFIDMTCHEIRNPLGAVMHCADLIDSNLMENEDLLRGLMSSLPHDNRMQCEELNHSSAEAVNTIISCSAHQKRIMDDILTLSKLDSKLLDIVPSCSRLDDILKSAQKVFDVDARKVDVTLDVFREQCNETPDVGYAMLDVGRVMQFTQKEATRIVTLSMKVSRTKFSEQDLGIEYVPLSTVRDRNHGSIAKAEAGSEVYVYFKVSDSGCGFDDEQKLAIFERFAQASPRTHSTYGGSGLGLFITRELIELQGGEIGVRSQPGVGSTFAFYIVAPVAPSPVVDHGSSGPLSLTPSLEQQTKAAKYVVLVVEDNLVNQKVLKKQLVKLGHEVFVVSNGLETLTFLETASCWKGNTTSSIHLSIILMDIEMPIMDGITCAREIRAAEARGDIERHLPIIAVSANARRAQVNVAMECGMDDAISKPFRIAELVPKIKALCGQYDREPT